MRRFTLLIVLLSSFTIYGQSYKDTVYHVELSGSTSGILSKFRDPRYNGAPDNIQFGYGIYVRAMWHPGRMLSMGFMSGFVYLSRDEFTPVNTTAGNAFATLTAIPLQVAVSMQGRGIEIGLGMGPYIMKSTIEYGSTSIGRRIELGLTFYGCYKFPVTDNLSIGPEIKALYMSYRGIFSIMPSITLHLDAYRY
jgi:hypothetical protein